MCNRAVNNYADALEYVYECFKTQKTCEKAVDILPSVIRFVTEYFKTQEM